VFGSSGRDFVEPTGHRRRGSAGNRGRDARCDLLSGRAPRTIWPARRARGVISPTCARRLLGVSRGNLHRDDEPGPIRSGGGDGVVGDFAGIVVGLGVTGRPWDAASAAGSGLHRRRFVNPRGAAPREERRRASGADEIGAERGARSSENSCSASSLLRCRAPSAPS